MKHTFLILTLFFILAGCAAQEETLQKSEPVLSPQVEHWIAKQDTGSTKQLGVLVTASEPLDNVPFLRKIKENYYTGRLTVKQIKQLTEDPRVKNISTGMSRLQNNR
ncbi:MAG TPA: hypothetical protein ENK44_00990 [Caldithrix abyssi]|uniref:Helix-hairpin-helix domain-containing protein n=1 Tax=Caldithrix abyssi TaxID=187145 RepID=A0A7V4TXG3_CALAY|nr:hypothetical protein [Caldithrix abyssi]